ncbi:MurR/RpiR family transcriptional regulator [Clostridium septicum]|uniref:MurR/RpiR family transcriptional regulator n=1 Tax=Clostridium septicum TaxID=1504 RepID=A0A9N7PJ43_CLOSE|nr:MurR/RpiR family transcriptional regulator [Clostridium septicum]AYE34350.1 MurR/RpiR family transcriptional regulator [Clostridium septicum]MDU1314309.1 MurR/RpiR family transcriptional regulator [Clostridium septicum]QAS59747.1 MurR/RpiR family transcriptional regulator [Clostridium septicum]UEC21010.1 MurR/RpiR family transcriptional regulator [Clostridium septicum]USS00941.1 MurR/RpiR family transcriptional regulator [Clostridium septicum]
MFTYQQIESLNDLELQVYDYIIKNQHTVLKLTIRELAQKVHVSTTTILRFCKKMGCDGFFEFKYKLKEHLTETSKPFKLHINDYAAIDYFKRSNHPSELQKIIDASKIINKSKQIIFLGIGTSGILAKYASRCFINIGKFAVYIDYPYFLVPDGFYDETVIIVFSVSGETEDIINQIRQFRKFNCVVISITNSEISTIAKLSDLVISYYFPLQIKGENKINLTSQIPVMNIIEKLTFYLSQSECIENK